MHFDWTALGTWATFFSTILIGVFVYGRLTERVSNLVEEVRDIKRDLRDVQATAESQGHDLTRIKTFLKLD